MVALISYQDLDILALDIDHVINHYDSQFAGKFSVATACSFQILYPDLQRPIGHFQCINIAKESYAHTGRTTAFFKDRFPQIDEMDLYIHHHGLLCRDGGFIDQQFAQGKIKIDPDLPDLLNQLNQLGVRFIALTNGTEGYAKKILGKGCHDIAKYFDGIYGMDSVDNPYMSDKRHGAFINDILDEAGLLKRFNNAVGQGMQDFDHSRFALLDDTHRNLRPAGFRFGMQTILQVNNPLWQGPAWSNEQTHSLNDVLRKVIQAKSQPLSRSVFAAQ